MNRRLVGIALFIIPWSLACCIYLASDVTPSSVTDPGISCGGVVGSLKKQPTYGGEQRYPDDWVALCNDAATQRLGWIAVPASAASFGVLYLIGRRLSSVRRQKRRGDAILLDVRNH